MRAVGVLIGVAVLSSACASFDSAVRIDPESPARDDDLRATWLGTSTDMRWSWERDGELVVDLTGPTVPADRTALGERWTVIAAPVGTRRPPATASVTVSNRLPAIRIDLPETHDSWDPILADVQVTDSDGDVLDVRYEWTRDGASVDLADPFVDPALTAPGQVWTLTVEAWDGHDTVTTSRSTIIGNAAPYIVGGRIEPQPGLERRPVRFVWDAVQDPDGDLVSLSWVWRVDGAVIARDREVRRGEVSVGDVLRLEATVSDGTASRTLTLATTILPDPPPAALVVALDITGSFANEIPLATAGAVGLMESVEQLGGPDDTVGMVVFTYRFANLWTPLTPTVDPGQVDSVAESWTTIAHASRIPGPTPDPLDGGPRPHMPREYDGEVGTDHSIGLRAARELLLRDGAAEAYRAVVLITDGVPVDLRASSVRDDIGYVESRWETWVGPAPHGLADIESKALATAEAGWTEDGIHLWVISLRADSDFMRALPRGDGTFRVAAGPAQLEAALAEVAASLPEHILLE